MQGTPGKACFVLFKQVLFFFIFFMCFYITLSVCVISCNWALINFSLANFIQILHASSISMKALHLQELNLRPGNINLPCIKQIKKVFILVFTLIYFLIIVIANLCHHNKIYFWPKAKLTVIHADDLSFFEVQVEAWHLFTLWTWISITSCYQIIYLSN